MRAADPHVQAALDGIRILADPSERQRAHVTVRGPYAQRYVPPARVEVFSRSVEGERLEVIGVSSFFGARQNTVFFKCESDALRAVWWKPDYPEFTPHITLYDGPSRDFAERLLEAVASVNPRFSFAMTRIEPLVTVPGQQGGVSLVGLENEDFLATLSRSTFDPLRIDELSAGTRISGILRLAAFLNEQSVPTTSPTRAAR